MREQLGGFYLIVAKGLDDLILVADPSARIGSIEMRPIMQMGRGAARPRESARALPPLNRDEAQPRRSNHEKTPGRSRTAPRLCPPFASPPDLRPRRSPPRRPPLARPATVEALDPGDLGRPQPV